VTQANTPLCLPVVLTVSEVKSVLNCLDGMMAALLYGGGLRLMECMGLRVKGGRIAKTLAIELLLVLEHPQLSLHSHRTGGESAGAWS